MKPYSQGARDAVAEAHEHLGYREGPRNNENPFGDHYGWNYVAWCVQFAWYCGDITGSGGGIPKTASTGAAMWWAKSVGRWRTTPQPGDWSIMVNSRGATIHTDLVESYDPKKKRLVCIGGNTSGTFRGSVNEGNGVYRNNRWDTWKRRERIIGFVRPLYGISTEEMQAIQAAAGVKADGQYGPATRNAVKALQRKHGLTADGFPGPSTWKAIGGKSAPQVRPTHATPAPSGTSGGFADVDHTQRMLNELYGAGLTVDGKYGSRTAAAVKTAQKDMGITADGKPGPATRKALEKEMSKLDRIEAIVTENQKRIGLIPKRVLDEPVDLEGAWKGQKSNLRRMRAWYAEDLRQIKAGIAANRAEVLKAITETGRKQGLTDAQVQQIADAAAQASTRVTAEDVAGQLTVTTREG